MENARWKMLLLLMNAQSRKYQRGAESPFGIVWIVEGYGVKSSIQSKYSSVS
jgi:hypothetical protein